MAELPKSPTGKDRSQRIQIDYYKRRTVIDSWRTIGIVSGVLFGAIYGCYVLATLPGDRTGNQLSTGPIATVHASFEQECSQCHQDFTPLDPHAPSQWLPILGIDEAQSREHLEAACQKCHEVGPHYRSSMHASFASIDQNCAGCHADHQGRDHDLTAMEQRDCSQCHADLNAVVIGEPKHKVSVVGFDQSTHGDFRSLGQEDPGRIRFSHHQHLLPGQVAPGEVGGMTIDRLRSEDRSRYRRSGQSDQDVVQLDCSSCHALAGQEFQRSGGDSSSIDQVMLSGNIAPIQFDQHCSACHSISSGSASPSAIELPHAAVWSRLDQMLAATIQGDRAMGTATGSSQEIRSKATLGVGPQRLPQGDGKVTPGELAAARQRVAEQCLECHDQESITDEAILAMRDPSADPLIPGRWLNHGYYDHAAHRQLACQLCHAEADPSGMPTENLKLDFDDSNRVMISGIEICQACHRPAGTKAPAELAQWDPSLLGGMPTWASDQCTLCHRYHTDPLAEGSR
ncbi:multiheme c-type cytochrome [Neorhodopirellula pilleata]|uniref:Doubled CXXCH motif n=1 Tax=Neorhodopirellula pilleata TaxID=2714738 RepID=A0A5C6AVI2_9BACT|nr:cytochrome c3 family protein [Neorhodopirellula pilleata]TWU03750.1 Doubled CXXCH motif [Neorhodopirellula pilleata]